MSENKNQSILAVYLHKEGFSLDEIAYTAKMPKDGVISLLIAHNIEYESGYLIIESKINYADK